MWSYMEAQPAAEPVQLRVPQKGMKKPRFASVELRFARVSLRPTERLHEKLDPIEIYAVYLKEPNPPEGVEPLSWMLLTTIEVGDVEHAVKIVEYYTVRWSIEISTVS